MKNHQKRNRQKSLLALLAASVLSLAVVTSTHAQGSSSDISGVIATTSSVAGGTFSGVNTGQANFHARFTSGAAHGLVNTAAERLNRYLSEGLLLASSTTYYILPMSESTRTVLACLLINDAPEGTATCQASLVSQFESEGADPEAAQVLVTELVGLTQNNEVSADQLMRAIGAYNGLVRASSAEFLVQPSEEFMSTRAVLSALVAAADAAYR